MSVALLMEDPGEVKLLVPDEKAGQLSRDRPTASHPGLEPGDVGRPAIAGPWYIAGTNSVGSEWPAPPVPPGGHFLQSGSQLFEYGDGSPAPAG